MESKEKLSRRQFLKAGGEIILYTSLFSVGLTMGCKDSSSSRNDYFQDGYYDDGFYDNGYYNDGYYNDGYYSDGY